MTHPLLGTPAIGVLCPAAHPVFLGRMVSLIITRWFALWYERERERETRGFQQVRAALRSVIPYFLGWLFIWMRLQVVTTELMGC
jgi:hypothetical protein